MRILALNAGSSSLKASLMESAGEQTLAAGEADWAGRPTRYQFAAAGANAAATDVDWSDFASAVRRVASDVRRVIGGSGAVAAVAHRVVHGGTRFTEPVRVTAEVEAALQELTALAPLHNPCSLEVMDVARQEYPDVPHVAVFDTAFHATLAPEAFTYPVPFDWTEDWHVRRFGFHGLSHAYAAARAADLLGRPAEELRLVTAHLGHGASLAAIRGGRSVDTTMGFTPLEGLMMATRSGSIDPGLVLYVEREHGLSAAEIDRVLNHESGLLGVSGVSADMREVEQAAAGGNRRARVAIAIYVHRVRQAVGAMAATLGGCDALVFTGGVGEHAAEVRAAVCEPLAFLGLKLDAAANEAVQADANVSAPDAAAQTLVVTADEQRMLCREAAALLAHSAS
jgi:acetate kinase